MSFTRRLRLESLERRDLLAADLGLDGVLVVTGTQKSDSVLITTDGHDVTVNLNGEEVTFHSHDLQKITIDGQQGHDEITIDEAVTIDVMAWGRQGKDTLVGGGGNDCLSGGNGKDHIEGQAGNDLLQGGNGKDWLDGGDGEDLLDPDNGKDHLQSGLEVDLNLNLAAALTGASGSGHASWGFADEADGNEWEFDVQVSGLDANTSFDVYVDDVLVGQITTDVNGDGQLNFSQDPDGGEDALTEAFPVSIVPGSVVSVRNGATEVLSGTL